MQQINKIITSLSNDSNVLKKIDSLLKDSTLVSSYNNVEDLFVNIPDGDLQKPNYKKFFNILEDLHYKVLTTFHQSDIYISPSLVYEYFFSQIKANAATPQTIISELGKFIQLSGLANPAIVIYPLLNFGIEDAGLIHFFSKKSVTYLNLQNFIVSPQVNKIDRFYKLLEHIKKPFQLQNYQYDKNLLEHYFKSRPIEWTYRNPLLIAKVKFSSHGYYENENYLVRYLERSICKLFLLNELIKNKLALTSTVRGFSTSTTNNFSTKDFKHYLVFTQEGKTLEAQCIPTHDRLRGNFELSNINMDIPLGYNKSIGNMGKRLLNLVDDAFLKSIGKPPKTYGEWHFYSKLQKSLSFFVRSCQSRYLTDQVIYLAVAFEMLFADQVKDNISKTLSKNVAMLFPSNSAEAFATISNLYNARSGVAHEGTVRDCDIDKSRILYINALDKMNSLILNNKIDIKDQGMFNNYSNSRIRKLLKFLP